MVSFYAPSKIASAIDACIREKFGTDHGARSRWFREAAQRDLRARGLPDGSEPVSRRDALVRSLLEAAEALPEELLQAKVQEMTSAATALAGSAA